MRKLRCNSSECFSGGFKMSDIDNSVRTCSGYVVIGGEADDNVKEYRVEVVHVDDGMQGHYVTLDLEDILVFAGTFCRPLVERVLQETSPYGGKK